jgi:hypothetical protein
MDRGRGGGEGLRSCRPWEERRRGGDVVSLCARWGRSGWATDKERASPRSMGGEKAVEMDVDRSLTA